MVGRGKQKSKADAYEFTAADDEQDALHEIGKQLSPPPKSKDAVFKLLKKARASLEKVPQGSDEAKLSCGGLAKALASNELVHHKDKEVRLYTAFCLCQVLRIYAPETPFSDAQLKEIFALLNVVYSELEDTSGPHFQLCLSIFETVSQVKCSVLMLDLDAEDLVCDLFSTVFGAINEENQGVMEASALELLSSLLEESDDVSQQLLDAILVNLLPQKQQEQAAAYRLAQELLRRTESRVQPYLQKFLTNVLLGMRTDSELRDDCHALIFQLYQVVPQVLLPVLPHLSLELQVDSDTKRGAAVELLGRLFAQPGSSEILSDYADLFRDLLKRLHDQKVDVRTKVLSYCPGLLNNCSDSSMRREILQGILDRLMDVDDRVRSMAAAKVREVLEERPGLGQACMEQLVGRLRDKKVAVRKEVATQVVGLIRAWCMKVEEGAPGAPKKNQVIQLVLVLCNLCTRDADLCSYALDSLFRNGLFPAKLPVAKQAEWWAATWHLAGKGKDAFSMLVRGKITLQRRVRELLQLRDAAKERQQQAGGPTSSFVMSGTGSGAQPSTSAAAAGVAEPEKAQQLLLHAVAKGLHDVHKAEEGLQKLWEMKDNHIFRGLATVATYGIPLEEAKAAGKDVMQRVGTKGPAAEVTRALIFRMAPSLLSPEMLGELMECAGDSEEAQVMLTEVAALAPQLFGRSMEPLTSMLEQDDPALSSCAARILARAGRYLQQEGGSKEWEQLLDKLEGPLLEMCSGSSPTAAKAAVYGLTALLGTERATSTLRGVCDSAMDSMKRPSTINNHALLLTAIKAMSAVGRTLPQLFAVYGAEFTDFVLDQLLSEDLSRGKPLRQVTKATGEEWGRPSPDVEVKAAALKALAQSFVPDNKAHVASKQTTETVQVILDKLLGLVSPEEDEGIGADKPMDAGWFRCAAASAMLRLARGYDHIIGSELYVELALSLQDPYPDARRTLALKVHKTVRYYVAISQRAGKYAALLSMLAVDPLEANQSIAFKCLREYVTSRRLALQQSAQATAAAGGGGNLLQEMPEFILPYLVFILAHHPDYPTAEDVQAWEDLDEEEQAQEVYPLVPFQNMLQFVLEALIIPPEANPSVNDLAQAIPATLKLLRAIKLCEDSSPTQEQQQHTQNAHQLCDMAMALVKAMVDRVAKGKPIELSRFPGEVVLPRSCFRAIDLSSAKAAGKGRDGSDLPPGFLPLLTDELYSQRFGNLKMPGAGKRRRPRSKAQQRGSRQQQQREEAASEDEESGREEEEDADHSTGSGHEAAGGALGSSSKRGKGGKRLRADQQQAANRPSKGPRQQQGSDEDAEAEDMDVDEAAAAGAAEPRRKSKSPGSGQKKSRKKGEAKPQSPATRQQPRRGAKAVAATKLRADTSDEESEEEEQQAGAATDRPRTRPAADAAAGAADDDDPMSQSDFENASMGSPAPAAKPAPQRQRQQQQQHRSSLRASTEDEEPSQDTDLLGGGLGEQPEAQGKQASAGHAAGSMAGLRIKQGKSAASKPTSAAALKPKSKNIKA